MRNYGTIEGRKFLHSIRCDGRGCDAEIRPNPEITTSGWMKCGTDHGPGTDKLEWDYCPDCWSNMT